MSEDESLLAALLAQTRRAEEAEKRYLRERQRNHRYAMAIMSWRHRAWNAERHRPCENCGDCKRCNSPDCEAMRWPWQVHTHAEFVPDCDECQRLQGR